MTKDDGIERLRAATKAIRALGGGQEQVDAEIARNTLHGDLGYFSETGTNYSLDEDTRDRLIAHARQDASHAVVILIRHSSKVDQLQVMMRVLMILLIVVLVIVFWKIW